MPTIPGIENINFAGLTVQIMYWLKIFVYAVITGVVFIIAYIYMTYTIKVTEFRMYGSGQDGVFSVAKRKTNRVKWGKNKTSWKPMLPLFNKKEIEPMDAEFIYPGNQVYAFVLNGDWIPGRINISKSEDKIKAELNPVPYYVRNWQSLQHKKNAIEFAAKDWWTENKTIVIALLCGVACLAACCATIYFTYKYAGAGRTDVQALTTAIKGFGNIPGTPPM